MAIREHLLSMFDAEVEGSRTVLAAIPEDKFDWRPHDKSWTLRELSTHLTNLLTWGAGILNTDVLDLDSDEAKSFTPPNLQTRAEILEALKQNAAMVRSQLEQQTDETLAENWELRSGDHVISSTPRSFAFDRWVLDHGAHHRGQLTVYLRMLDIPVPGVFGPSADENFG